MKIHLLVISLVFCAFPAYADGVLASIKPLHSLVAGVMEGAGTPELIVGGNTSPHEFQLKPSQMAMLQKADMVFYMDDQFETFLSNALSALPKNVRKVPVAQTMGITLLPQRHGGTWELDEHEHGHEHVSSMAQDFHVWLDPEYTKELVARIAEELSARYPENEKIYRANAKKITVRLSELDKKIAGVLKGAKDKSFIVFHDAYQYFERRYGLRAVGSITFEPEEAPSIARIRQVREKIKQAQAVCVFSEPYFSDKLVNTIREGSTTRTAALDPEATALSPGAGLYFMMMEGLAENIKNCLQ